MGFFDDIKSSTTRGVTGASRTAKVVQLRAQIGSINKDRQNQAAQLGDDELLGMVRPLPRRGGPYRCHGSPDDC
jgi:hypothetical protein